MRQLQKRTSAGGRCLVALAAIVISATSAICHAAPGDYVAGWGTAGRTVVAGATANVANFEPRQALATADGGMVMIGSANTGFSVDSLMAKHGPSGAPDPAFGRRIIRFSHGTDDYLVGAALQPDGKLVAVGSSFDGSNRIAIVARFLGTDGSLDTSFGVQGWLVIPRYGDHAIMEAYGVTVDSSNRIVVVGTSRSGTIGTDGAFISRITPAGAMDPTFATGGTRALQAPDGAATAGSTSFYRVIQQPVSGAYVVAGGAFLGTTKNSSNVAVARVSTAGVLDTTFGVSGWALRDMADRPGCPSTATASNCASFAYAIAAYSDGRLAVAGNASTRFLAGTTFNTTAVDSGDTTAAFVDWLTINGAPDALGSKRFALKSSDWDTSGAWGLTIDSGNNLFVAAQTFGVLTSSQVGVVKFNSAGGYASGFQSPGSPSIGIATTSVGSGDVRGIAIDGIGNVKVGGRGREPYASDGRPRRFYTVRFTSAGLLDTTYDTDGKANSMPSKTDAYVRALAPHPVDDSLMVFSAAQDAADPSGVAPNSARARNYKLLLTRLTAAGIPDPTFGTAGSLVVPRYDEANTVSVGSMLSFFVRSALRITLPADPAALPRDANDGKYLASGQCVMVKSMAGTAVTASDTDACVVRLNVDGSIDTTFGSSGFFIAGQAGYNEIIYGMRLHSAAGDVNLGKIILAVEAPDASGTLTTLLRLNANGTLDSSFNGTGDFDVARPVGSNLMAPRALRIDSTGSNYVVGGFLQPGSGQMVPYAARVTAGATMDPSFGTGGVAYGLPSAFLPAGDAYGYGIALYNSGRVLLTGSIDLDLENVRQTRGYVLALTPAGTFDPTFGDVDGIKILDNEADTLYSEPWLIGIEAGGRALVASTRQIDDAGKTSEIRMTRLNFDGALDTSFNGTGFKALTFEPAPSQPKSDVARAFNLDSRGNIYVAGATWNNASDGRVPAVAKLEAEGISVDSSYRNFYAIRAGQPAGGTYQAQYVYAVSNRSAVPQTLNTALAGVNAGKFTLDTTLCSTLAGVPDVTVCSTNNNANNVIPAGFETPCGATLAAAAKCHLLVSFRPALADVGYFEASLNVGDLKAALAGHTCYLDTDRDTSRFILPQVEGLLYLRYMFGLRGAALVSGINWPNTIPAASLVEARIVRQLPELDLDGDNMTLATSDGLMLLRAMLGLKGTAVTNGAVNPSGTRSNWDAVQQRLRYTCAYAISAE